MMVAHLTTNADRGETSWSSFRIFDLGEATSEGDQGGQKEGSISLP